MTWFSQVASLLVIALSVTPGEALECFLCSYSPRGNTTRQDRCTDQNFIKEETEVKSCNLGCESVTSLDVNGEMESFHRNCATQSTIITNSCETYNSILLTKRICSCDWQYCNSASKNGPKTFNIMATITTAVALSWLLPMKILTI